MTFHLLHIILVTISVLCQTCTAGRATYRLLKGGDRLEAGQKHEIVSGRRGKCKLQLKKNGNLIAYRDIGKGDYEISWYTGRNPIGPKYYAALEKTGNLAVYKDGIPIFESDTAGPRSSSYELKFDQDCRLLLFRDGTEIWTNIIQQPFRSGSPLPRSMMFSMFTRKNGDFMLHLSPECIVTKWDGAKDLADRKTGDAKWTFQTGSELSDPKEDCHIYLGERQVLLCKGKFDKKSPNCPEGIITDIQNIWALSRFYSPRSAPTDEFDNIEGNRITNYTFNVAGSGGSSIRYQQVHHKSEFDSTKHKFRIYSLAFLKGGGEFGTGDWDFPSGVQNKGVTISLSTTKREPDSLVKRFKKNVGSDEKVVFRGDIRMSPHDSALSVDFQRPFLFDPSKGNLLLDIRVKKAVLRTSPFKAHRDKKDGVSRVYSSIDKNGVKSKRGVKKDTTALITMFEAPPTEYCLWLDGVGKDSYVFMTYVLCD